MKLILSAIILSSIIFSCSSQKEKASNATPRSEISVGDTVYLESGVKYVFMKKAKAGTPVEAGRTVATHINLAANGIKVWSTYEPLQPFQFVYKGYPPMIKGFDEVLMFLQAGDQIMAVIPSHLGYGEQGAGANIPPNALLHFDIEILSVE